MQLTGWFLWFILIWIFVFAGLMAIGGFFMFRKFLKKMPKEDGKSVMDWEEYFVNQTRHLWGEEEKHLLEDLVSPVPELFRDVARHKIAGKIGELALNEKVTKITEELVIRGYIQATPKRDHKFLRKKLFENRIDVAPYEHLF
jgi:DNA phosphorothioation-dependent restriction protein DptG